MHYGDLATHRLMVRDEARTTAFQKAIAAVVRPGDVVLDVGAGCGILSLFAAQAGAARVYAVERDVQVARFAEALAVQNGFAQTIQFVPADIRAAGIPEQVDVIVSEWMGTIGIDENMYGAILWARDNLLREGGRIIPAAVTAMLAPAAPSQRADSAYFAERPYGLDLGPLTEPTVNELLMVRRRVVAGDLAAPAQPLWRADAATDTPDLVRQPIYGELSFTLEADRPVSALALWFEADLGGGIVLRNAPDAPDTHWGQMLLPLEKQHALASGDRLKFAITAWPVGPGPLMFGWRWQINDGPVMQLDTAGGGEVPFPVSPETAPAAEAPRSALSRYLARLAIDADALAAFLGDPERAVKELDPEQAEALMSRDPHRIGMALFEREAQA